MWGPSLQSVDQDPTFSNRKVYNFLIQNNLINYSL